MVLINNDKVRDKEDCTDTKKSIIIFLEER